MLVFACAPACGEGASERGRPEPVGYAVDRGPRFDPAGWRTDFSRRRVPLDEIARGGPARDAIPPIDRPEAVPARRARGLIGREPVVVVEVAGAARAYPMRTLVWHEVVNDRLGGRPIAVTYAPLTSSTLVFDRRVGRRELSFGTTGNLRRSNPLLWDRATESWWQQLTGEALVGALAGARPRPLPAQVRSWAAFRREHPRGTVLARPRRSGRDYERNPYLGYDDPERRPHLLREPADPRLPPKERVVALLEVRPPVAVPFSRLARERVVELDAGGLPVVLLWEPDVASAIDADDLRRARDVGAAAAFERRARGRVLSFERRGAALADRETGSRWDGTGRAFAGPLRGARLRALRHDAPFWFAVAALVPDVSLLRDPASAGRRAPSEASPRAAVPRPRRPDRSPR